MQREIITKKNGVYSIDFKQKVLKSIDTDSLFLEEACVKFNIPSPSTILLNGKKILISLVWEDYNLKLNQKL